MISVITITYNRAAMIAATIESVLAQTHTDFEYIIVDDGSEDKTKSVIEAFGESRIKYSRVEHCGQISKLRNIGIKQAEGDWIAFIDSDDLWDKDKLALQMEAIERNDNDFCFANVRITKFDNVIRESLYSRTAGEKSGYFFPDYINNQLPIYSSQTMIFRRHCFDQLGGLNEKLKSGDHDFICRLLHGYNGVVIYQPLATVRRHDSNHSNFTGTRQFEEYIFTLNQFFHQNQISSTDLRRLTSLNHYLAGLEFLERSQYAEAKSYFWKSFLVYPWRLKALARLAMSILRLRLVNNSPH